MPRQLLAGVARADTTPPVGIAHGNWGAQTHERAAGVDRSLHVTALALSDGDRTVVTVDFDLLYLHDEDAKRVRETVAELTDLPAENVRVSYTHTHSGPTPDRDTWAEEGSEMLDPYLRSLPDKAAGAAWEAVNDLEPIHLSASSGQSTIAINRRFKRPEDGEVIVGRNPDGVVDHEVKVVRIDTVDGDPVAAIVNYACHPITVGPDNDLITPDYPGVVKETVREETGAACLFLQGATGDVGPIRGLVEGGVDQYEPLGKRLGLEASRVWWEIDPNEGPERYAETVPSGAPLARYESEEPDPIGGPLRSSSRSVPLPVRELPSVETAREQYHEHRDHVRELRAASDVDDDELHQANQAARQSQIQLSLSEQYADESETDFEVQIFAVGDELAFVAIPGEPFVDIQLSVKRDSPFGHTLVSGYSNVGRAYIPTEAAYPEGGYEVETTPFAPGAAELLVKEVLNELGELYAG